MLNAKFPLYALRANFGRVEDPPYILINSRYRQYILDMPSLPGNYFERRLKLAEMDTGLPLYPLKEKYTTIAQILRNPRRREFIDSDGKIWKISKCKTYPISSHKVLHRSRTWNGKYLLQTKVGNFVTSEAGDYVVVVDTPKGRILFDVSDKPSERVRIKL